jgi:hypothetical protein
MTDCGKAHHWDLESPEGELIPGKCRNCGAVRDWPNKFIVAEGRPFITRDPLIPRSALNGVGGYQRTADYY